MPTRSLGPTVQTLAVCGVSFACASAAFFAGVATLPLFVTGGATIGLSEELSGALGLLGALTATITAAIKGIDLAERLIGSGDCQV